MIFFVLAAVALPLLILIISPLFRNRFQSGSKLFLLHGIDNHPLDYGAVSPEKIRQYVPTIRDQGFRLGTIADALRDDNTVALTFDDGYDSILAVTEYFAAENIPITVFIPTAWIGKANNWENFILRGRRRHLSAEQVRHLSEQQVEFGSHGHSHSDLTALSKEELCRELELSRKILEDLTGKPVRYLACPFGKRSKLVDKIADDCGYEQVFTATPAPPAADYKGRIPINKLDNEMTICSKLSPSLISGAEYLKCRVVGSFSRLTGLTRRVKL